MTRHSPDSSLRPIFIVGCPRSGTTLTQSLLGAHSALASFPESHFFPLVIPNRRITRTLGIAGRLVRRRLIEFLAEAGAPELVHNLPRFGLFIHQYTRAFAQIADELAARQQKHVWIEKTPGHVRYIEDIQRYIGPVKFVHVLRNGPDTITSLYQVTHDYPDEWHGFRSLEECVERWIMDVRLSLACRDKPGHTLIRYEELVKNTACVMERLCQFAGLPFEEQMLHSYTETAASVALANEPWKREARGKIVRSRTSKFTQILDDDQQQYILNALAETNLLDLSL